AGVALRVDAELGRHLAARADDRILQLEAGAIELGRCGQEAVQARPRLLAGVRLAARVGPDAGAAPATTAAAGALGRTRREQCTAEQRSREQVQGSLGH